jgi:pyrroloquinoline quinone biosynthesis protein D
MAGVRGLDVPKFPRGVKLRFDAVRGKHLLLAPERVFELDEVAVAVVNLVDGRRTIDEIVDILSTSFEEKPDVIRSDVATMLRDLAQKRVVEL